MNNILNIIKIVVHSTLAIFFGLGALLGWGYFFIELHTDKKLKRPKHINIEDINNEEDIDWIYIPPKKIK